MKKFLLINLCLLFAAISYAQVKPCADKNPPYPPDTTIILKNGTELTFNRCDFFDIKDCIEFYEIRNLKDLQDNDLTTQDNEGDVLLTCGMFILKINKSEDCDNKECLDNPVKIRIPILQNPCLGRIPGPNELYKIGDSKAWERIDGGKEVENEKGQKYLEYYSKCGGKFNCDKKLGTVIVKFKARKYREINSFTVTSNCPLLNLKYLPKKRKNIVYAKLPCLNPDSLMITITGTNSSGEVEKIAKPLSQFISKYTKSGCTTISQKVMRRILGIFPLRELNVYKKYLIN